MSDWITYARRHKEVAESWHAGHPTGRVLVFSVDRFVLNTRVPVGGFADRIKGITTALMCALVTDRSLFIDWTTPTPLAGTHVPAEIDWSPSPEMVSRRPESRSCDWVDSGFSAEIQSAIRTGRLESDIFGEAQIVTQWINLYRPDMFSEGPFAERLKAFGLDPSDPVGLISTAFDRLFRFEPTGGVLTKYEQFQAWAGKQSKVLGVQFRTGGGGRWADPEMDTMSNVDAMARAAIIKASQMGDGTAFFITSDYEPARAALSERLSQIGPVFVFDVAPTHIDLAAPSETALLADYVTAEFHALRSCDDLVVGIGMFGVLASWIAGRHPTHYTSLANHPAS